jgi:hypothetical protein
LSLLEALTASEQMFSIATVVDMGNPGKTEQKERRTGEQDGKD